MAVSQDEIRINYTDREINSLLAQHSTGPSPISRHFSQNENFFLKLNEDFFTPSFPVHHDVRQPLPTRQYLDTLKIFLSGVVPLVPQIFRSMTYFFDPADIHRPGFFQLYKLADAHYLYMLRIDLAFRTHDHTLIQQGTNTATAEYRSKKLFLEGTVIPIESVYKVDGKISSFKVKQTISQTWIGETGRGYMIQGIWIDNDLTKFFSKLFLPPRKRTYPYYPFKCKYRTVCQEVIDLDLEARKKKTPYLHRAFTFISPVINQIQDAMRASDFSEELPVFKALKRRVPPLWNNVYDGMQVTAYLNEADMKEFIIEDKR